MLMLMLMMMMDLTDSVTADRTWILILTTASTLQVHLCSLCRKTLGAGTESFPQSYFVCLICLLSLERFFVDCHLLLQTSVH